MAHVLIVGAGVLGSRVAKRLKSHALIVLDRDIVEPRNLKACGYRAKDVGIPKAIVLAAQLKCDSLVGDVQTIRLPRVDVIVDCTDNLAARFAIERRARVPWVHAAAEGAIGECMACPPGQGFSAVFGNKKDSPGCSSTGINLKTADVVARVQARLAHDVLAGRFNHDLLRINGVRVSRIPLKLRVMRRSHRSEGRALRFCDSWQFTRQFDFSDIVRRHRERASSVSPVHITIGLCSFFRDGRVIVRGKERKEAEQTIRKLIN